MTAILLNNLSYRLSNSLISYTFVDPVTVSFDPMSQIQTHTINVNSTNLITLIDTISINNAGYQLKVGDDVLYYTSEGNTSITGLTNNTIYKVVSANTTEISLGYANGVSANISASLVSESGHYLKQQLPLFYFATSKHTEWDDENLPDVAVDSNKAIYDFNTEILFGKKITRNDIAYMIRKVVWTSNNIYNYYDDQANNLNNSDYFVLTSSNNVYKCLYNNGGGYTTIEPSQVSGNTFSTSDGYVWKYMYTLSGANNSKFSTANYIPIDANASIKAAAVNGAIEFIKVESGGNGYFAYANGYINDVVNQTTFRVETGNTSSVSGYYTTSSFYIYEGPGDTQITTIADYVVNASGHYVITSEPLVGLGPLSKYLISPNIKIYGDGTGAKAVAVIDTTNNTYSINAVTIINKGVNYSFANINIETALGYGSGAVLRPIMSPRGGHGSNPVEELGSTVLGISVYLSNNESNTISTKMEFRKLGLIYDPRDYSDVSRHYMANTFSALTKLEVVTGTIPFSINETIVGLSSNAHAKIVYANSSYMELTSIDGNFIDPYTNVSIITNSGTFTVGESVLGSTSTANGSVVFANSSVLHIKLNGTTPFDNGEYITGSSSSANATVNSTTYITETISGTSSAATALISSINNPDIKKFSAEVLFLDNFQAVNRSDITTEVAKLLIGI